MTLTSEDYYTGFRDGDEKAFEYVYGRYYKPLHRHGYEIIEDEFAVNCIVNEAFLKGWAFREQMENMRHIYCFIRQEVNWKCYAYFKNPSNRFHCRLVHPEYIANIAETEEREEREEEHHLRDKKLKAIEEALPYLPGNRQTIMTLYFKYGYSYKRIARRFGTSNQAINTEVQKSLESLRRIVLSQKRLTDSRRVKPARQLHTEGMEEETRQIYNMRYVDKQSFASIAAKLQISLAQVQQQYVMAHRRIKEMLGS
jgi:RNA polymerase sigma factor (sigma-70 family)